MRRAFKAKISNRKGGEFYVLQGGRTQKYRAYFKDGNIEELENSSLCGALYSDCIV